MKQQQAGFTLIELIMVIVILGILAATALPKFIDLQGDAKKGVTEGVAGSLSSASAMNYAACLLTDHVAGGNCTAIAACDNLGPLVEGVTFGSTKDNYALPTTTIGTNDGDSGSCTVRLCTNSNCSEDAGSITFTAIRAGNAT